MRGAVTVRTFFRADDTYARSKTPPKVAQGRRGRSAGRSPLQARQRPPAPAWTCPAGNADMLLFARIHQPNPTEPGYSLDRTEPHAT